MITALIVIAILVVLIVVHEFGHFISAKLFGVRVEEFGIGYPPRAFLLGAWGGTEYTINWIPFGGFVRLFGEERGGGPGSFMSASRGKQAVILLAGVIGNVVAAWLLFTGAYAVGIVHVASNQDVLGEQLLVTDVVTGSPADAAGIMAGDTIVSIVDTDGAEARLTPSGIQEFISERGGDELAVVFEHIGERQEAEIVPAHAVVRAESDRPAIGIGVAIVTSQSEGLAVAMKNATVSTYNSFALVVKGLGTIIGQSFKGELNLDQITGPVGLVGVVGETSKNGLGAILSLAAFISVNLAVINLIPIPALDGGRLVVVGIEALMRRRAPALAIQLLNTIGVAAIILLMIAVTYHDVVRLLL